MGGWGGGDERGGGGGGGGRGGGVVAREGKYGSGEGEMDKALRQQGGLTPSLLQPVIFPG